ncbi:MAG: glycosyltransferase family 1 protein [Candidatus Galacturonibacter soehngenii]|nr:glycosyltransferase family 1 protein [Candidatus Galacturonibacter soehngenii]
MKGKILVLKGQSRYSVLRDAADYMSEAFSNLGYEVKSMDLLKDIETAIWEEILKEYDLIFSFQALLFDICMPNDTQSVLGYLKKTKVFGQLMDYPNYHKQRLTVVHGSNMYIGCIDKNHVDYIKSFYPYVKNVSYLPHAGCQAKKIVPYQERSIDVYFPCSYTPIEEVENDIGKLDNVFREIARVLIDEMLQNPMLTLQDALYLYFKRIHFTYTQKEFIEIVQYLLCVDNYIRAYSRDKLCKTLIDNKINLTVSGKGWEHFKVNDTRYLHILEQGGTDFKEVIETMGKSKMVLNNLPTYQQGTHERIFSGMMSGAISVTNNFPCIHQEFKDKEDIILYSNDSAQELAESIKFYLEHATLAEDIANKGKEIALQLHSWEKNAERVLKAVGLK